MQSIEEVVWTHLCSNPIHVFQLTLRLHYIKEKLVPYLEEPPCESKRFFSCAARMIILLFSRAKNVKMGFFVVIRVTCNYDPDPAFSLLTRSDIFRALK